MRLAILFMVLLLLTATVCSAYRYDVNVISPTLNFVTGLDYHKYRTRDVVLTEDPVLVQQAIQSFNGNLDLEFWNDPRFHPGIFLDSRNYEPCGRYPVRFCISLNEYGGFVIADRKLPDDFVGYGAYDRMRVSRGKLFPTGDMRYRILYKNMELLSISNQPRQIIKNVPTIALPTWYKKGTSTLFLGGY